jgi:hypothetical protein
MHVPINVKSPNNTSKWQMGFNSAFKMLMSCEKHPEALQSKSGTALHPSNKHIGDDHALHAEPAVSRVFLCIKNDLNGITLRPAGLWHHAVW